MKNVRPRPVDLHALKLTAEEGFVLSRVDAPLALKDIVALTGLDESRVRTIVERLASEGALEFDGQGDGTPARAAEAAVSGAGAEEANAPSSSTAAEGDPSGDEAAAIADVPLDLDVEDSPEEQATAAASERSYRQLYETVFRGMETGARAQAALSADAAHLMALCLDPEPVVIDGVLGNPRSGMAHARMIATHHRSGPGLEMVARRTELLADGQVQRRLLRNPQITDALLRRIVSPKPLSEIYKVAIDREIPERSRLRAREQLQRKFMLASADERAALLVKTEGRCLLVLVNCALDSRTTQILCQKTQYSPLFVQNLARWSATPPMLLGHLLKQAVVRLNPGMRKMLLKHPNAPAEAKRNA